MINVIIHLMYGLEGNSWFCFPESPNVSQDEVGENIRTLGKMKLTSFARDHRLRTFALIVCAQPFCTGNATVICHASLRLTGPEDKHGVENAGEKISGRVYSFGSSVTPIF